MSEPAEFVLSDLTAINKAIKSGALIVQYNNKRVEYRNLKEMFQIRKLIRKCLGLDQGSVKIAARFDKGVC